MSTPLRVLDGLAPDPVLPRRDDLLDDGFVGARLDELFRQRRGAGTTGTSTRLRAKYRIGESLRATFRIEDGTGATLVSARMFAADEAAGQFLRAQRAALLDGAPPGSVMYDESLGTVFWVFPQDRKLRGLAALAAPPADLRSVFGAPAPWAGSELMAYSPEKAATARCTDESGATLGYAKVAIGDEGSRSIAMLRAVRHGLARDDVLRVPVGIGYLPTHHMAFYSPAPGRPLNQLARAAMPQAMAALGAALAVLHQQPLVGFEPFTRLAPGNVRRAGELVSAARPDLTDLLRALVTRLLATVRPPAPGALLHGDLHPKNVLVHDSGVSLVDLDQAGAGPPAAELGAMLARLWCPRPSDGIDPGTATAAADALLAAYGRPPAHDDLLWYAAAALLVERALRAVNRVDVASMNELEPVLTTALRWAEQLPGAGR